MYNRIKKTEIDFRSITASIRFAARLISIDLALKMYQQNTF